MLRLTFRNIRSSLGRWIAIFAIIALGVGFLAGLMQTCPAMLRTMSAYVRDSVLYDWRVVLPDGIDPALTGQASSGVRGLRALETAVELDDNLREQIKKKAESELGKNVVLHESIDKSIIGGIIMSTKDERIDASLLTRVERTREALKQ